MEARIKTNLINAVIFMVGVLIISIFAYSAQG